MAGCVKSVLLAIGCIVYKYLLAQKCAPGAVSTKSLTLVLDLNFLFKSSQLKPKNWLDTTPE